jgi:predicted RND superfamily exporter protein
MVNVVLIPLVFGLGVDNGIHIVMRHREGQGIDEVLRSSTPRAILLSGLTTLGAFGALSVSDHAGISSLGVLLSLAMIYLFFCTLLVLPALLWWRSQRQLKPQASRAELQPELLDEKN